MEAISIKSRLGSIGFKVNASIIAGMEQAVAELGLRDILMHSVGSAVQPELGENRANPYTDELAGKVNASIREKTAKYFTINSIENFPYVKPDKRAKFVAEMTALGLAGDDLAKVVAAWDAKNPPKQSNGATNPPAQAEPDAE